MPRCRIITELAPCTKLPAIAQTSEEGAQLKSCGWDGGQEAPGKGAREAHSPPTGADSALLPAVTSQAASLPRERRRLTSHLTAQDTASLGADPTSSGAFLASLPRHHPAPQHHSTSSRAQCIPHWDVSPTATEPGLFPPPSTRHPTQACRPGESFLTQALLPLC